MAEKKQKNPNKEKINTTNENNAVRVGNKVKIDYVGSFEDGKVFDESVRHGQPIEFVVGSGRVIPGFDQGVIGMKIGDEKIIVIEPKDGYGDHNKELVKVITRDKLPKDKEPTVGMIIVLGLNTGQEIPARITQVKKDLVTIDMNHPLAGKKLNFKIKLVGLE